MLRLAQVISNLETKQKIMCNSVENWDTHLSLRYQISKQLSELRGEALMEQNVYFDSTGIDYIIREFKEQQELLAKNKLSVLVLKRTSGGFEIAHPLRQALANYTSTTAQLESTLQKLEELETINDFIAELLQIAAVPEILAKVANTEKGEVQVMSERRTTINKLEDQLINTEYLEEEFQKAESQEPGAMNLDLDDIKTRTPQKKLYWGVQEEAAQRPKLRITTQKLDGFEPVELENIPNIQKIAEKFAGGPVNRTYSEGVLASLPEDVRKSWEACHYR